MKITKRGEYAFKIMMSLAKDQMLDRPLTLREISAGEKLPLKFLEQIMILLRRAELVESSMGSHGGYKLARPANEITLGEIIRSVDGPLAPVMNAREIKRKIDRRDRHSGLYLVLMDVRNAIAEILDKKTLADVLERSMEAQWSDPASSMYYI